MSERNQISRRQFLYGSAIAAAGVGLAACAKQAPALTAVPAKACKILLPQGGVSIRVPLGSFLNPVAGLRAVGTRLGRSEARLQIWK